VILEPEQEHAPLPVARAVRDLRVAVAGLRAEGRRIAFVPTMGALHEGHLSLVRAARDADHAVVLSVFLNPTQFGPSEDLERYPRREREDLAAAAAAGVDLAFLPSRDEMYPPDEATRVHVGGPAERLEGAARPGHFAGVATVVTKLVLAVRPDRLVLGQKDAQQVAVIRRMLADLLLDDVEVVTAPTVREADGLALSSRNAYLDAAERRAAPAVGRALAAARALAEEGEASGAAIERAARATLADEPAIEVEYAALVDPQTFAPVARVVAPALLCIAARLGTTRLIDNVTIPAPDRRKTVPPLGRTMLKSKIHRARVTDANLDYVGSITIDADLLDAADIRPYEQVTVLDVNNGARFETYTIEGPRGGGDVCLNGPAARLVHPGDVVIVLTYATYDEAALEDYEPLVVHVDAQNRAVSTANLETVPDGWGAATDSRR